MLNSHHRWLTIRTGRSLAIVAVCAFGVLPRLTVGQAEAAKPFIAPASDEGLLGMKQFRAAPGLKVDLWAAEPLLANPVAFSFDERGRAYVCESFRIHAGVDDIRDRMPWLDEELAARTVDDRLAEMKRHLGNDFAKYSQASERLRLIEDRDGDGVADHATVFAEGFNTPLDGIGSGVLARKGNVWYANIPNFWLLRDTDGDGVADSRKSLHYGYGVRFGFYGHDLHGVHFGPDGRIYFSIGDRGANLKLAGGSQIAAPDSGSVFRCNPDGSELEIFATGLRNPQDLVFDQFGNLFTGDNNSDSGDQARWVHLVEGGDSGWRVGYQFLERPYARGPFNAEKLWHPSFAGQAAYLIPPVTNIASGPSGVAYFPGTGLPARFRDHFFLVDFRGAGVNSGVHTFTLRPKGASFELVEPERFIWGVLATDARFGVDGGLYVSDWVQGWGLTGKGRIYRVHDPALDLDPLVLETKRLLAERMERRSLKQLAQWLAHPDQRVRQEAQFELAARGTPALKTLMAVARRSADQLARLHAIWGIGQIGAGFVAADVTRRSGETVVESASSRRRLPDEVAPALNLLVELLIDGDAEVRAQSARVLGESRHARACDHLITGLSDNSPRVRFFTAMSLGKLGRAQAVPAILTMLRTNADKDPYLRHAGVMALTWIGDMDALLAASSDNSASVRLAVVLAMRRLQRAEVAVFLNDRDPSVVLEAARAINDEPINGAMRDLAALLDKPTASEALLRRVLNANFRLGAKESAQVLAHFASATIALENMRVEALDALADWEHPSGRDRVVGLWRPVVGARAREDAVGALVPGIAGLLRGAPDSVRVAAIHAVSRLKIAEGGPVLSELVGDPGLSGEIRAEALKALSELDSSRFETAIKLALADANEELRIAATLLQALVKSSTPTATLAGILENGTLRERQAALASLGQSQDAASEGILSRRLDDLVAGQVPKELQLDVLEAAAKRSSPKLKAKLVEFEDTKPKDDPLWRYRETFAGGNAALGLKVFFERADAQCVRCHKIAGQGGDVGPDLSHIGAQKERQFLLESIVLPNQEIAQGFESVLVTLKSGATYAGVIKSESADGLVINSPEEGGLVTVKKDEIQARRKSLSPMPEDMGRTLSKQDLRNLVEFLSSLK